MSNKALEEDLKYYKSKYFALKNNILSFRHDIECKLNKEDLKKYQKYILGI